MLAENTWLLLKVVVPPTLLIWVRIDWNSRSSAAVWLEVRPLFEASVASVMARLSNVVTCASAPSAVCSKPILLVAFCADCVSAPMLACMALAIDRPAASSAPELIFEPDDSCASALPRLAWALESWLWACSAEIFVRILRDILERLG